MTTILLLGAKSKLKPLESVPAELSRIKQLFGNATSANCTVDYEPYLTRAILGDLLRKHTDQANIIHFAGHSGAEQLQTDDELVYARHIAGILQTWDRKPDLLFLNGCNSAGQVESFLAAGIPCVIATHNYIDDREASQFAYEFYANLLAKPDKVTLANAFTRAGALVVMGQPRQARSLDISTLDKSTTQEWDWGLFSRDPNVPKHWTLTPPPPKPSDFMRKAKLERAQARWQLLFDRLTAIETQYALETRAEEKLRIEHILEQNRADLAKVEQEVDSLSQ
ncbi:MAG: CHAT domain-containing protein [Thiothrix sp.]|uniref:CHAT domain-containing protein n=1 Tax=Thiothrix sp. TaxID=1032 RepID=UPI002606C821|nr:CHAT domain-containing protein [Thiothrix sp.]MDD5394078.1 CHAT domain-containing protein [Thiothrix sp.]